LSAYCPHGLSRPRRFRMGAIMFLLYFGIPLAMLIAFALIYLEDGDLS